VEPETEGPERQPVEREEGLGRTPAYVAFGVGAVGMALGTAAGILALGKRADLSAVCDGSRCPPNQEPSIDKYHRLSWASGVGFGVGLAGAASGLVFLLTSQEREPQNRVSHRSVQLFAGPCIVGGSPILGLRGDFE
jgi:hypothetical protein